jgi:hypothetical protein
MKVPATPFPGDPLTYVIRTISEFDSVGFAESKEANCFAGDEGDLIEIDCHLALFLIEQFSKGVHMLSAKSAAHA